MMSPLTSFYKPTFINFKLVNSSNLRLKHQMRTSGQSDLQLKDSETHAMWMHAHIVVSPTRQQCTALTSYHTNDITMYVHISSHDKLC